MRTALLLGLVTVIASTSVVACAVEEGGTTSRRPKKVVKVDDADDEDDEDEDDVDDVNGGDRSVGSTNVDPGNPAANSVPTSPASPGQAAQGFSLALDKDNPTVDLGKETTVNVTVTPKNGFNGTVNVVVEGLPAGVTAAPASGAPGSPIAVKLTSTYGATVTPKAGAEALVFKGTSGSETATANANFKILPKIEVHIPVNAQALLNAGGTVYRDEFGTAFGKSPTTMKTQADNPIVMTIFNDDSRARVIHFPGSLGHGDANKPIQPGAYELQGNSPRVRSLKTGTNATGYFHGDTNGQAASFKLIVAQ
ncbi:MAG: hypothetical protein KIT84_38265 [Labilithrix sp.]|nr:hypothetical protein [Labilithrix sp.]MCW5816905.1 hypothetical protein [Labilithrix sp.]